METNEITVILLTIKICRCLEIHHQVRMGQSFKNALSIESSLDTDSKPFTLRLLSNGRLQLQLG